MTVKCTSLACKLVLSLPSSLSYSCNAPRASQFLRSRLTFICHLTIAPFHAHRWPANSILYSICRQSEVAGP